MDPPLQVPTMDYSMEYAGASDTEIDVNTRQKSAYSLTGSMHEQTDGPPPRRTIAELTPESVEITRSNAERPIVPDTTDYSYHEEDDDDNTSIHHGTENEDETISVGAYDRAEQLANSLADPLARTVALAPTSTDESVLPVRINDQLEKWYARHGRMIPKCVTRPAAGTMSNLWYHPNTRAAVRWMHRSGVALGVKWYDLPGRFKHDPHGHNPKLIVVSGPGVQPSIARYANAGGYVDGIMEPGVVYKIWQGVDGDKDGFENKPSVIKLSRGNATSSSTITTTKTRPRSLSHSILVEVPAVKERPERNRKPSARYSTDTPQANQSSKKRKRSKSLLEIENDDEEPSDAATLLSKFMSSPGDRKTAPGQKLTGVPPRYSCYLCSATRTERKLVRYHVRHDHGITTPDEARIMPVNAPPVAASAASAVRSTEPRLEVTSEHISNSARETVASDVDAHIRNNTTLIFFSSRSDMPRTRTRTFASCDTIQKLFAQATAGHVFNRENSRVLDVQIEIDGEDAELPIVEDDEQDYNDFVSQLQRSSGWTVVGGQIEGECVVFVREKRK